MKFVDIKSNIKKFLGVPSAVRKSITREGILVMNPQNIVRLKNLGYSNKLIGKMAGVSDTTIGLRVKELKGQYKSLNQKHGQKKEIEEKEEEITPKVGA